MEITLLKENDPLLKQVSTEWDFTTDGDPSDLITNLTRIMIERGALGLAAPQCGINKRMFIMGNKDKMFVCINPKILEADGNVMDVEGCLSFPDLWLRVRRADNIRVRYNNALGELVEADFSGLISRVFQHEYDHLDGICFDTRVAKLSLELAKNRRKKKSRKSFN